MDIRQAQKILAQAEAAKALVEKHRENQLRNAYKQFDGIDSNEELIAALQARGKSPAKKAAKAGKRTRTKITAEIVSKIKALADSGSKAAGIAEQVGISYVTALKAIKGQYDKLLAAASIPAPVSKPSKPSDAPKPRKIRKTNNVKVADLTDTEKALIKAAKSYADIKQLPKGTKNAGKNVMFAVYANVRGVKMGKQVVKKVVAKKTVKKAAPKKAATTTAPKKVAKKVVKKAAPKKAAKKAAPKKVATKSTDKK